MEITARFLNCLVPITQFNRGQASRIFDRLRSEPELIVLKNNQPSAVILSPSEYARLSEIEENYMLLMEASKRLSANEGKAALTENEVMGRLGITEEELAETEEPDIE